MFIQNEICKVKEPFSININNI